MHADTEKIRNQQERWKQQEKPCHEPRNSNKIKLATSEKETNTTRKKTKQRKKNNTLKGLARGRTDEYW